MKKQILASILMVSIGIAHAETELLNGVVSGVSLDQTRVVIENGKVTAGIGIQNKNPQPMMVSAWVTDLSGKTIDTMVVNPSIFQLGAYKSGTTSIRLVDTLPQDRESVFWLKVNSANAGNNDNNHIKIALGQRIKIFYRPKGLTGDAEYAAKNVVWTYSDGVITAKNTTALSVSVSDIYLNDRKVRVADMIMPFDSMSWKVNDVKFYSAKKTFTFINEYGGIQEVEMKVKDR